MDASVIINCPEKVCGRKLGLAASGTVVRMICPAHGEIVTVERMKLNGYYEEQKVGGTTDE